MTMIEREPEVLLLFMEFWAYGVRDARACGRRWLSASRRCARCSRA